MIVCHLQVIRTNPILIAWSPCSSIEPAHFIRSILCNKTIDIKMDLSYVSAEKNVFYYESDRESVAHGCQAAMCYLKYRAVRAFMIAPV